MNDPLSSLPRLVLDVHLVRTIEERAVHAFLRHNDRPALLRAYDVAEPWCVTACAVMLVAWGLVQVIAG
jgi:hypothetical protein